jgi:uncharacterized membrane protein
MLCLNLLDNLKNIDYLSGFHINSYNIILIIMATFISALGLLYNNTAAILGSMLISSIGTPLVTSVILFVNNYYMKSFGKLLNFLLLVIICTLLSIFIGYLNSEYLIFQTPTNEMLARITYTHVVVDVLLALASGIVLGFAIINKDLISRAGVSLILSITPPLANFGMFYGQILQIYTKYISISDKDKKGKKDKEILKKKLEKLSEDGNKSFILFLLNIVSMYSTLLITLIFICM